MEYIKGIVLFLVFVAFVENILSINQMKKYIRLICGIMLIFIVIKPIGALVNREIDVNELLSLGQMERELDEWSELIDNSGSEYEKIKKDILYIVGENGYECTYFHIIPVNGGIGEINITIKEKKQDIKVEKISLDNVEEEWSDANLKEKLATYLGVSQEVINIVKE